MHFLRDVFGDCEGYLCIVQISGSKRTENFFEYPKDLKFAEELVADFSTKRGMNTYFYPVLFEGESTESTTIANPMVSADLNMLSPVLVSPRPDLVVESSRGRFQAYWHRNGGGTSWQPFSINGPVEIDDKLRRIPGTYNWKYSGDPWKVSSIDAWDLDSSEKVKQRLELYGAQYESLFRSTDRWTLARYCARLGASAQDVFLILQASQDFHGFEPGTDEFTSIDLLYREAVDAAASASAPTLLSDVEIRNRPVDEDSFISRYVQWASGRTDSPKQYHVAGGLIILTSLLCPHLRFEVSFGEFRPNLWFMILAGTTITRKTTAMDTSVRLLECVNPDIVLSTNGSAEGIISALADRDGESSLFYRDEIAGLLFEMARKEYMAGMMESLTRLYDGGKEKRTLRRQTIQVNDPHFHILSGGIKSRVMELLTAEHVASGFIPRFLIVCGWSGIEDMKPIGPPGSKDHSIKESLVTYLEGLRGKYSGRKPGQVSIMGMAGAASPNIVRVTATAESWDRMRKLESDVRDLGLSSDNPDIFGPIYERMMNSIIKVSILLAADRAYREEIEPVIELTDLVQAISYADVWLESVYEIARGIDDKPTEDERKLQRIEHAITSSEDGVSRGDLMRRFRLSARAMTEVAATLVQRGTVVESTVGNKKKVYRSAIGD